VFGTVLFIGCDGMTHIILKNVSIDFPIYHSSSRSFKNQLIRLGTGGRLLRNAANVTVIKALDDISIEITHGDRVGLIGHNGAGKSTFLRVLSGIYEPMAGSIVVDGKISPLLDLMSGIEPESTGYENITIRGILLGFSLAEIRQRIEQIAAFTGLGDYLSMPIRTYSAGMRLRLAFGVATCIAPEILILDEVVGAGDRDFMDQAKKRLNELITQSSIVVLATHSHDIIQEVCNKVIWFDAGRIKFYGDVATGLQQYESYIVRNNQAKI